MRATDKHFYNIKRLHVVFAVSSAALLAVTVWMLVADHRRTWKEYQRTFRDRIEPWMTRALIHRQETPEFRRREAALVEQWDDARRAVPDGALIERFREEVRRDARRREAAADFTDLDAAQAAMAAAPSPEARETLLGELRRFISAAARQETRADRQLRFRRAEFDQARSYYEAGVGEDLPPDQLIDLQQQVDRLAEQRDRAASARKDASAHRKRLEAILAEITREEDAARKALADHRAELARLDRTLAEQFPNTGKRALRWPLIDALGRPLAVEQIWLPELTIDYNFRQVARFDRCATCHQGIDKPLPAFDGEEVLTVELATPNQAPQPGEDEQGRSIEPTLESVYGLVLAEEGILDPREPTVEQVRQGTPATFARLRLGDVIVKVNDVSIHDRQTLREELLKNAAWGEPISLEVRRGLPHPYGSHPRLDLFVGSHSPHPMAEFGCTICHDGQGSATEFSWASHTPNDPDQRADWRKRHGWFRNPHWDFSMMPRRFAQSRCLKCHHEVTDLEPAGNGDEPPAAKLLAGYHLVRQLGCFGCHQINGFDESGRSIGPDMRLEPSVTEAASPNTPTAKPGTMRKVGPSLRGLGDRLKLAYLLDWTADPRHFLPTTRMPRFYGLHEHLDARTRAETQRLETVEIRAVVEYLLQAGDPVEPLPTPVEVTEPPSAERGKRLFQVQGCLACHRHADFPEGQGTQGPDLSRVGAKYTAEAGAAWLVDWLRDPTRHSPRTLMPNPLLELAPLIVEKEGEDPAHTDTAAPAHTDTAAPAHTDTAAPAHTDTAAPAEDTPRRMIDPAADIAAYLLNSQAARDWQPNEVPTFDDSDLDALAARLPGGAIELTGAMSRREKLRELGCRTIRLRGCYGCHDIPGFEDAQPIGPALSDWGRKQESLLAFGQIHRFVEGPSQPQDSTDEASADRGFYQQALLAHRREGFLWQKLRAPRSFDYGMARNKAYRERLKMGRFELTDAQREAVMTFILGLVAEPPAAKYVHRPDARKQAIAAGRKVLDRYACAQCHTLQMERWAFDFDPEVFEGPVAAPDYEFLRPDFSPEQIAASSRLDNRGLGSAEVVGMPSLDTSGRLQVADFDEDDDGNELYLYGFSLWEPAAINGEVYAVGGGEVLIGGLPSANGRPPIGKMDVSFWGSVLQEIRPPVGGAFARLLYPIVLAEAKAAGANVAGMEGWGWVPPPLVGEGAKVRPDWLYNYLLDPYPIRPALQYKVHPPAGSSELPFATTLRMPRYNMSPSEASRLVDYFAAVSGVPFPYISHPANRPATAEQIAPGQLAKAMSMLIDTQTYCAKCHLIGDFSPGGEVHTILAPRLDRVGGRLRAEYLRRWLANPKAVLPYTGMPVNFPAGGDSLDPARFPDAPAEQLEAIYRLLLNYHEYLERRMSIRKMVQEAGRIGGTEQERKN